MKVVQKGIKKVGRKETCPIQFKKSAPVFINHNQIRKKGNATCFQIY
jgi:hypothetical protein